MRAVIVLVCRVVSLSAMDVGVLTSGMIVVVSISCSDVVVSLSVV